MTDDRILFVNEHWRIVAPNARRSPDGRLWVNGTVHIESAEKDVLGACTWVRVNPHVDEEHGVFVDTCTVGDILANIFGASDPRKAEVR